MDFFGTAFTLLGSPVTWAELVAFGLSLWMVERNIRERVLAWPLAIVASLIYLELFRRYGLYGEASLQLVFVTVSCWGWWQWWRGRTTTGQPLVVHSLSTRGLWVMVGTTLAAWPLVGFLIARFSDSTVPYHDAFPTAASLTGQWLLAQKVLENWTVWAVVNVFSVGLFAYKALWLTALLYALFAVLSVVGWRAWRARLAPRAA